MWRLALKVTAQESLKRTLRQATLTPFAVSHQRPHRNEDGHLLHAIAGAFKIILSISTLSFPSLSHTCPS